MKTYDLYFGEPEKEDFRTFYFEPENFYQGKLGSLFMVGTVDSSKTKSRDLLKNLGRVLRGEFFSHPSLSSSKSLSLALKRANRFLRKIAETGDLDWLPSFGFGLVCLKREPFFSEEEKERKAPEMKKYKLSFAKVGRVRIRLLRGGEVIDLGEKIEREEIEPYPLTVFSDVVSGKLREGDRILLLSEGVYHRFLEKGALKKLSSLSFLSGKRIKRVIGSRARETKGVSACVFLGKGRKRQKLVFREEAKQRMNLAEPVRKKAEPLFNLWKKLSLFSRTKKWLSALEIRGWEKLKKRIRKALPLEKLSLSKKKVGLLLFFSALLLGGHFVARWEARKKTEQLEARLQSVEEKRKKAWAFFRAGEEEKARKEYLAVWKEARRLAKERAPLYLGLEKKKGEVRKDLLRVNKTKEIKEPEPYFEFEEKDFLPQSIILSEEGVYLTSPYQKRIAFLDKEKKLSFLETEKKVWDGTYLKEEGEVVFRGRNDGFLLKEGELEPLNLEAFEKKEGHSFFTSFFSHLYLARAESGEILKWPSEGEGEWAAPEKWLKEGTTLDPQPRSMAIDGGIWVLYRDALTRYFGGESKKEFSFSNLFPPVSNLEAVATTKSSPHLYLLESNGQRVIVLDKEGSLKVQYRSPAFENLKDIGFLQRGEKIFFLSGARLYTLNRTEL